VKQPAGFGYPDLGSFSHVAVENKDRSRQKDCTFKIRKRGRKGGVRQRMKNQTLSKIPLPTILLTNAQSLRKKTDELQAMGKF